jgi:uncharacterized protein
MKKILWVSVAILVFLGAFFLFQRKSRSSQYSPAGNVLESISLNGNAFKVEVVSSAEKITLGLSGRDAMCENCGMLFVFGSGDYRRFWMKDMKFDLDMLWITGDKVVYVARNVSHEKGTGEVIAPVIKADKVLELNAGTSDQLGIKAGDLVSF